MRFDDLSDRLYNEIDYGCGCCGSDSKHGFQGKLFEWLRDNRAEITAALDEAAASPLVEASFSNPPERY